MPKITSSRVLYRNKIAKKGWWCCDMWFGSSCSKCPVCGAKMGANINEIRKSNKSITRDGLECVKSV